MFMLLKIYITQGGGTDGQSQMCLYYFILAACFGFSGEPSSGNSKYKETSLIISTPHQILYVGDQIKSKMDRACGAYGRQERHVQGFGGDT